MLALWDDRPLVEALLDRCQEYVVAYAGAMAEAGLPCSAVASRPPD